MSTTISTTTKSLSLLVREMEASIRLVKATKSSKQRSSLPIEGLRIPMRDLEVKIEAGMHDAWVQYDEIVYKQADLAKKLQVAKKFVEALESQAGPSKLQQIMRRDYGESKWRWYLREYDSMIESYMKGPTRQSKDALREVLVQMCAEIESTVQIPAPFTGAGKGLRNIEQCRDEIEQAIVKIAALMERAARCSFEVKIEKPEQVGDEDETSIAANAMEDIHSFQNLLGRFERCVAKTKVYLEDLQSEFKKSPRKVSNIINAGLCIENNLALEELDEEIESFAHEVANRIDVEFDSYCENLLTQRSFQNRIGVAKNIMKLLDEAKTAEEVKKALDEAYGSEYAWRTFLEKHVLSVDAFFKTPSKDSRTLLEIAMKRLVETSEGVTESEAAKLNLRGMEVLSEQKKMTIIILGSLLIKAMSLLRKCQKMVEAFNQMA